MTKFATLILSLSASLLVPVAACDSTQDVGACGADSAACLLLQNACLDLDDGAACAVDGIGVGQCAAGACEIDPTCGDGVLDPGEACDDGNNDDRDGCDYRCALEVGPGDPCDGLVDGDACTTPGGDGTCAGGACVLASCGDNVLDPGEDCDDGNSNDGDGCSFDCVSEFVCGDGLLDLGESCDDGNHDDGDGCSARCEIE